MPGWGGRIRTSAWRKELIVNSRVEAMNFVAQPKVEETHMRVAVEVGKTAHLYTADGKSLEFKWAQR